MKLNYYKRSLETGKIVMESYECQLQKGTYYTYIKNGRKVNVDRELINNDFYLLVKTLKTINYLGIYSWIKIEDEDILQGSCDITQILDKMNYEARSLETNIKTKRKELESLLERKKQILKDLKDITMYGKYE